MQVGLLVCVDVNVNTCVKVLYKMQIHREKHQGDIQYTCRCMYLSQGFIGDSYLSIHHSLVVLSAYLHIMKFTH